MDDLEERDVPPVDTQLRTGNPEVDGVLDSMDSLDDLPVTEHVGVFERAHEVLRGALDARPDA
jgi:hypothetical protein